MTCMQESQTHCIDGMSRSTQYHRYLKQLMGVMALLFLVVETSHAAGYVYIGTPSFYRRCPTWYGGDREYSSNGPSVTAFAQLSIVSERWLYVRLYMNQIETKSNWSRTRYDQTFLLYTAPAGRRILDVWNAMESRIHYVDTDHAEDVFLPTDTLVREFRMKGDTSGNDIGNCTSDDAYLSVYFESLWVWIE